MPTTAERITYGREHHLIEDDQPVVTLADGRILTDNYSGVGLTLIDFTTDESPASYDLAGTDTPYNVSAANMIDALWCFDGERGGSGDVTATISALADLLSCDMAQEWREQIVEALCRLSHTSAPMCNRGAYNTPLMDGGVYTNRNGDEIAWWHTGAETRWMELSSCTDDERVDVGVDRA